MLRLLAGEHRSRVLSTPSGADLTRPMGSRTREAIFNLLRGWFDGATVLDLFAGVGTMGLEAVSRGAARVFMVEKDRDVFSHLKHNTEALRATDRAFPILGDALGETALAAVVPPVQLVFFDPPFDLASTEKGLERIDAQMRRVRPLFAERGFLVLRLPFDRPAPDGAVEGYDGPELHAYGDQQRIHLYAPARGRAAAEPPGAAAP